MGVLAGAVLLQTIGAAAVAETVKKTAAQEAEPLFMLLSEEPPSNADERRPAGVSGGTYRGMLNPKLSAGAFSRGDRLKLNLPGGREPPARVKHVAVNRNGTVTVLADVSGELAVPGHLLLSTTGGKSLGSLYLPDAGETWMIEPDGDGQHILRLATPEDLPAITCEASVPPFGRERQSDSEDHDPAPSQGPLDDPVEQVTVDVMIVYTPAARQWADTSGGGIFNVMAQAIARANLAAENSGAFLSWNLVHAEEVAYTETGDSRADLIRLTSSAEFQPFGPVWEGFPIAGFLDEVHDLRDFHGADLVTMMTFTQDTGGLGWVLNAAAGMPEWGFNLVRVQQAGATFTHAHELGHNLGLHHHREQNVQPGPGLFPYSAGWRWVGTDARRYCSVMTYAAGNFFDDRLAHIQVGHYSNPEIEHAGVPTGHPTLADNVRTLRETKQAVAAYRQRTDVTIGEAVGQPDWEWVTGGDAPWFAGGAGFDSGGFSARSGPIDDQEESWLETTVSGPANLSFWWRISSEESFDFVQFTINGEEQLRISGQTDWAQSTHFLPTGVHTLRWRYSKDFSVSQGVDAGWLDQVVWTPAEPRAPSSYSQWLAQSELPPGERGILDDPGGAGIPNWHRYAFGLDPLQPDRDELPMPAIRPLLIEETVEDYLTIALLQSVEIRDLIYRPEVSDDLVEWKSIADPKFILGAIVDGDWRLVTYRDRQPITDAEKRFLRVGIRSLLGTAVEDPVRDWRTGGNKSWAVATDDSFAGDHSIRSGPITHNQQSWVEIPVEGPGVLTFRWKVSSEAGWDFLEFLIDGEKQAQIGGEVDWEPRAFLFEEGSHTVRWRYIKDGSVSSGADAAWLDQVEWEGEGL